jgi:hypothetical protein
MFLGKGAVSQAENARSIATGFQFTIGACSALGVFFLGGVILGNARMGRVT